MNKRFFIAWLVTFVLWMLASYVVHGLLLHDAYAKLAQLFRSPEDSQKYFGLMILAHVFLAGAFVWIYRQGVTAKPFVGQGVRYGIAVAFLTAVPMYLIYYVVQPMPRGLVARQIVFDSIVAVVLGVVVAWLHRDTRPEA
jgi:hypothetical protein